MIGVAAVAFAATLTSCSKAGDLYDEGKVEEQKIASVTEKYDDAFIKAFGQPAANQDWGFGSRQLPASFGSGTRVANTEGNLWEGKGYTIPADISEDERNAVLNVFNNKGNASYTSLVDWDEFFVQQVYKGEATYKNHDNQTVTGSEHMDWLCTVTNKHVNVIQYWPYKEEVVIGDAYDDHINNFNNGNNQTGMTSEKSGRKFKGITLMQNTNSNVFGFKSSEDNGHVFYNFRMEYIAPYGYFVGFDFEANGKNKNEQVDRDLIYNDWIVKIVPGKGEVVPPQPRTYAVRIICEDLMANASSDFDFNDVVFDVNYTENVNKTFITIKAAGGTIPLYIEGNEVHKLFQDAYPDAGIVLPANGVKGTMINTNANGGVEVGDVSLELNGIIAPKDIAITINNGGTSIPLKANVGEPAAKIAVNPSFQWLNEREDITKKYENFTPYVKTGNIDWY